MGSTAAGLGAISRLARGLAELGEAAKTLSRSRADVSRIAPRPHKSMSCYVDPAGRFELHYPSSWRLTSAGGVFVRSSEVGTFARVDIVPLQSDLWRTVIRGLERAGATIRLRTKPAASHVHGVIELDGIHFAWDARSYCVDDAVIVLSLGNVVDARRSRTLEAYEDGILAAIRRHFRAVKRPLA